VTTSITITLIPSLQVPCTLDGRRLTMAWPIFVRRADEFYGGDDLGAFFIVEHDDFDGIQTAKSKTLEAVVAAAPIRNSASADLGGLAVRSLNGRDIDFDAGADLDRASATKWGGSKSSFRCRAIDFSPRAMKAIPVTQLAEWRMEMVEQGHRCSPLFGPTQSVSSP